MTVWIVLHKCPHGCGAQLGVSSRTEEGFKARCAKCGQPTIWKAGKLRRRKV